MAKQSERVERNAPRPSQNYLSLIRALIVLLCLSIGAGFAFASQILDSSKRWTLAGFLILFPCLAAGLAILLMLRNARRLAVDENDDALNWQIMSPESQRRKLNAEIDELAILLGIPLSQFSDLRSAYIVAEDLALRKIENEAKISLLRHVAIETAEFDAVLINENEIKCVEVNFLVTPDIRQDKVNVMLRKLDVVKKLFAKIRPGTKLILLLVLVTQLDQDEDLKLRSTLSTKLSATPVDVDIRMLDFEELQKIYAAD